MQHLDDAHQQAEKILEKFLEDKPRNWRILLIKDVFAKLRIVLWCPKNNRESSREEITQSLRKVSAAYWSENVLYGQKKDEPPNGPWQDAAWRKARDVEGVNGLRVLERHRAKTSWFESPDEPPWTIKKKNGVPICLFYSFKGGVGRSTALAATALHLATAGDRVVVLDADLDAPGVGFLLTGYDSATASWGIVDYLLEYPILAENGGLDIGDYYHLCPSELVPGAGEILVFPVGTFDDRYLNKLARLDYGVPPDHPEHPFVSLLKQINRDLAPDWILVDARAGLGDVSGFLTGGLCHFHVLFGTLADASWQGIKQIVDRLGGNRVREGKSQAECLVAAAMIPRSQEAQYQESVEWFTDQARDVFSNHYYAEAGHQDNFWTMEDLENTDAPHVPIVLPYDERLALFRNLTEVDSILLSSNGPYGELTEHLKASSRRLKETTK